MSLIFTTPEIELNRNSPSPGGLLNINICVYTSADFYASSVAMKFLEETADTRICCWRRLFAVHGINKSNLYRYIVNTLSWYLAMMYTKNFSVNVLLERKCQTKTILALVIRSDDRAVWVDVIFWCWYPVSTTIENNCNYFYDYQFSGFTYTYILNFIFQSGIFLELRSTVYPPTSLNSVFVYIIKHTSMYTIYDNNILL